MKHGNMEMFLYSDIITEILNRLLNCKQEQLLGVLSDFNDELEGLYPSIKKKEFLDLTNTTTVNCFFLHLHPSHLKFLSADINKIKRSKDILICIEHEENVELLEFEGEIANRKPNFTDIHKNIYMLGPTFEYPIEMKVSENFKVLAMIQVFNEKDIVERTIDYLINQELEVYIIDNWSDDGTYELLLKCQEKYPNRLYLDRFPVEGKSENFDLYDILKYKEKLAKELDYDWFIHYDMDEMRISPWENVNLRDAIYYIDKLGYNQIENTVIDFKLTEENAKNDIFMKDEFFDFGHKETHFIQTKTWKKSSTLNIRDSAGHDIKIENPKKFPLKILNRHYPYRSIAQAEKKIFTDRKLRVEKGRREHGWHGHYALISDVKDIMGNQAELIKWDRNTFHKLYIPFFLGCGIYREPIKSFSVENFPDFINQKLVIYGAGNIGKALYNRYINSNDIVAWVDKQYENMPRIYAEKIQNPEMIQGISFDFIVISVLRQQFQQEIFCSLIKMGINEEKIISM